MISGFLFGFFAVIRGVQRILTEPTLRRWTIIPIIVAVIVFVFAGIPLLVLSTQWLPAATNYLTAYFGAPLGGFWWWFNFCLLVPIGLFALGIGLYLVARLIAAPFYSVLAERSLVLFGLRKDVPFQMGSWLRLSLRMVFISLLRAVVFTFFTAILFVFSFIPLLNVVATIGYLHIVAFDVVDYGFEAMEWGFKRRLKHFQTHWPEFAGLAFGFGLAMLIPGLNLLMLPAGIVGACEILNRTEGKKSRS